MKTGRPQQPSIAKPAVAKPKPMPEVREGKPGKAFGAVLREKTREKAEEVLAALPPPPQPWSYREPIAVPEAKPAAPSAPVDAVQTIQALASELVERIETVGPAEVRIEFRSQVLNGLVVTARREGDSLDVRFDAATTETAALLAGSSAVLAERLERMGYESRISVHEAEPRQREQGSEHGKQHEQQQPDEDPS